MPIRVKCESCKKTLSVKDHLAGKKIKCPVCQSVVVVSASAETKAPAAPKAAPAPPAGAKKPAAVAKPAAKKPTTNGTPVSEKSPNGTPPADVAKGNGAPPKKPEPSPVELPPENVEAEALAAFADEPKPPEDDTPPQTIDFKCQWCDEELHLPIESAGKQIQCPMPECRRIIKVPMPKIEAKKDWRKMDRQGPASARVNMPEELDNAWGSENTTRAREASLVQAGVIELPKKPVRWVRFSFITFCVIGLLVGAFLGALKLRTSNQQQNAIKEIEELVKGADPKIKDPLLRAEAHRTLGLLYLREPKGANKSFPQFDGALGLVKFEIGPDELAVKEQLFLIELALSQIELGGAGDDLLTRKKKPWGEVQTKLLVPTLQKIETSEVQVLALREVGTYLVKKDQKDMAIQIAGIFSNPDANEKKPLVHRQQIALVYAYGDDKTKEDVLPKKKPEPKDEQIDGNVLVGFAEGYARMSEFDAAFELASAKGGSANDRLDAYLGIAEVALQINKTDKALEAWEAARKIAETDKEAIVSPWHRLQLVKLAARLDKLTEAKEMADTFKAAPAPFMLRAHLEIFLAKCDKATDAKIADELTDLEANDKDGVTLGLAWAAIGRQFGKREPNRKTFDAHVDATQPNRDMLRAMVDIGSYLGAKK